MHHITDKTTVNASQEAVFRTLSDFKNLEQVPALSSLDGHGISIHILDSDKCELTLPMAGSMTFYIKERTPNEKVVLSNAPSSLPVSVQIAIILSDEGNNQTGIVCDFNADMPAFVEAMAGSKLRKSIEQLPALLVKIPYDRF